MIKEYQSIMKNDVWDVVPRPKGKSIATSKWIYKIKHDGDGSIEKYKARFFCSWLLPERRNRLWRNFCTYSQIHFYQISTYLGCSDEMQDTPNGCQECFIEWCSRRSVCGAATRFETHDRESHVCRLKKSLYGLKQAPRTWYGRIDSFLSSLGLPKVKQIPTFTTRLNMVTQWYSYCM